MSTIVIHGTLARGEAWWRITRSGGFLHALDWAMQEAGQRPDVWTIGGKVVSSYPNLRPQGSYSVWTGRKVPPFDQIDGHCLNKWGIA